MALTDNLISYWKLDESSGQNATDAHGSLTLTDNNTVGSATGKINNGRSFSKSSSEYFSADSGTSFNFGNGDWAASCWINLSTMPDIGRGYEIFSKDSNATNGRQFAAEVQDSGKIAVVVFSSDTTYHLCTTSSAYVTTGNWFHLVYQRVGTEIELWVNGVSRATTQSGADADPATMASTTTEFRVGARVYSAYEDYIDGIIDELGIWSRYLTSDEIASLYNSGSGLAYPFSAGAVGPVLRGRVITPGRILGGSAIAC